MKRLCRRAHWLHEPAPLGLAASRENPGHPANRLRRPPRMRLLLAERNEAVRRHSRRQLGYYHLTGELPLRPADFDRAEIEASAADEAAPAEFEPRLTNAADALTETSNATAA